MTYEEEYINKYDESSKINLAIASVLSIVILILYISAIIHSIARLVLENIEKLKVLRIGFFIIALFLGPLYWLIYPLVYFTGGLKY